MASEVYGRCSWFEYERDPKVSTATPRNVTAWVEFGKGLGYGGVKYKLAVQERYRNFYKWK
ncbi:hypothetical protein DRN76_02250 [Methanosarcinales archaeon]|nr:MAG: hypothetical protein DRN76_02250 [Methanosarcinales archaeon]